MVAVRCRELGVKHVLQGAQDKVAALGRLLRAYRSRARRMRLRW